MGYGPQCQGGARVRGFSRSGKPSLLLDNTGGAVFPHPAEFFFRKKEGDKVMERERERGGEIG